MHNKLLTRLALAAALSTPGAALHAATGAADNWLAPGGGADESSYSQLAQITPKNAGQLGLVSYLDLPGEVSLEATPLAVDGVLYFSGSYAAVYAVEALSGKLLWRYDPEVWKHNPHKMGMAVNRGVAYEDGRVFVASIDGRVHALDAKSGDVLWIAESIDPDMRNNSTGAPRTFDGKVIIGNGGADFGARGFVTAFDAATGKRLWRFFTVPGSPEQNKGDPVMERAAKTWSGEYWKTGSGGTVWNGITFDPELNRLYIGTGNGGPYDVSKRSPGDGDNLYLASIVALDADTGEYIWHYQANPREAWDYKCTANMIATTLEIDGKPRKVLMQAPTNGFFYVLDRETGELISAEKIGKVTWAERIDLETGRPVENPGIRYDTDQAVIFPATTGAHNFQAMSWNPQTGLVYIPYMQMGTLFRRGKAEPGEFEFGGIVMKNVLEEPGDGKGKLIAWDPLQQAPRWSVPQETIWNGGTLATAGGLVFWGTGDGYFSAFDASNGERVWRYYAGLGIIGGVSSYTVDGKQYVSVLTGYGGSASVLSDFMDVGWRYGLQPRRLLTFALGGDTALPPSPPPDLGVYPVDDPEVTVDPADAEAGRFFYTIRCSACHGQNLNAAGGPAPDLRESRLALYEDSLWSVVHDGILLPRGMPRLADLSREQVRQIHAFIRTGAREALAAQP
ncbi:PQQ-dependent dehydrogenase, methanol/ethanol family [Mangrovimicrobium sediminis]|uniref:PQQ-dependent dehydrogenase, methanol/ethanol family n=1 Tax=Mangrovimicrobium sediminis TaxID=2562682 RepID=A0A4Z0M1L3_9GAMM|nr:PQQ-dependent dehydrogenase, methanol/ethanol family [Haliea sp. SAOS-164]TGD73324.1 PQQ-dependent dehydrogenase, methanol/ethanol family [Haliea sp. SAOS-164]